MVQETCRTGRLPSIAPTLKLEAITNQTLPPTEPHAMRRKFAANQLQGASGNRKDISRRCET